MNNALKHKTTGNEFFAAQNWTEAMKEYHLANMILKGINTVNDKGSPMAMAQQAISDGAEITTEEKKEAIDLQVTVKLNLAACLLKTEKPTRAVEELDFVIKHDPTSVKAYFRRGQAHFSLNNYEKAKADFLKAQEFSPADKVIPGYLKKIAVWEKEQDKKMANAYSNMFK